MNIGALILDNSGLVRGCNRFAQRILSAGDGLELDSGGHLVSTKPSIDHALRSEVNRALENPAGTDPQNDRLMAVPRRSGKAPFVINVSPMPRPRTNFETEKGGAVLVLADPQSPMPRTGPHLQTLYHPIDAERMICESLIACRSYRDIALTRGMSVESVKSQTRNLVRKVGSRNRADLMRLAAVAALLLSMGLAFVQLTLQGILKHEFGLAYTPSVRPSKNFCGSPYTLEGHGARYYNRLVAKLVRRRLAALREAVVLARTSAA